MAEYKKLAEAAGLVARQEGDAAAAMAGAARVLEADYEFPYLAHAPMEPLDCVAQLGDDGCDLWTGSQIPPVDQARPAAILGLQPDRSDARRGGKRCGSTCRCRGSPSHSKQT